MTTRATDLDNVSLELKARYALFLDFDGTLAPLQDNPDTVLLPPQGADYLCAVSEILGGALVIISGRDIRDLSKRIPNEVWRAGGHGLDICARGEAPITQHANAPRELLERVKKIVDANQGARLEEKGTVLAVHYRQNPAIGPSLAETVEAEVAKTQGYRFQHGKMVLELKPEAANKGRALKTIMTRPPFMGKTPIMVGDDTTDEDAMSAAGELGGFGIKVGEGPSVAKHRLKDPDAVWNWLKGIVNDQS